MSFTSAASSPARWSDPGEIVHELNNALAPIILSVALLRRKVADPDVLRQLDLVAGHAWKGAAVARKLVAWAEGRETNGAGAMLSRARLPRRARR